MSLSIFLLSNAPKEIHAIMIETSGEHAPTVVSQRVCLNMFIKRRFYGEAIW
jgi:hypothetical protein